MHLLTHSRLTGEPLDSAATLVDLPVVPVPGIYPNSETEAASLSVPFRVIQSADGFVQSAHRLPETVYSKYGFAGGQNTTYKEYIESFAKEIAREYSTKATILEVGCGDGILIDALRHRGFENPVGIDPSPQSLRTQPEKDGVFRGYFPKDLPPEFVHRDFDLIVCRHVLEHIDEPNDFVETLVSRLASGGQLWIEVPDLISTVERRWWTNFYPLHCNYFEPATLDRLMSRHGLGLLHREVVQIFGGSILCRYTQGVGIAEDPTDWKMISPLARNWQLNLQRVAEKIPKEAWGWGAAERTSATLGFCPALKQKLSGILDGNSTLHGKYLAGTRLKIYHPEVLQRVKPKQVVLFALSYRDEILKALSAMLPTGTKILEPFDPIRQHLL